MKRTVIFLTVLFQHSQQFNIDTNYPIVYEDPTRYLLGKKLQNYFGYSIVLYPGSRSSKPWILIGAPNGTDSNNLNKGTCFKCGIAENCEFFNIDRVSESTRTDYNEKMDGSWLGAVMDINYLSLRIVTCAPRWIKVKQIRNKINDFHMQGACYWFHAEDNTTQKLTPLLEPNRDIYTHRSGGSVYLFAQGEAGFSVHMPSRENELILGAPGVYNWHGTSILFRDDLATSPIASRLRNTRFVDEFNSKNIASAQTTIESFAFDLLGYAITSGYFYKVKELYYVTSSPRSDYVGQVLIYHFDKSNEQALQVHEVKKGQQFGEYFGAALSAGDLNGDGLDDLVVGAPFFTGAKYNEGKIYLFLGNSLGHLHDSKNNYILGTSPEGQFGAAVQYLGDIDHDGFGDLAVSAPFQDISGTVYIYRGSKTGLQAKFSQKIIGKNIYEGLRGFGASLSKAVDMDSNTYSDLAVGAFLSGHTVFLRSRPVITIFQELLSSKVNLDVKTERFVLQECFWYQLDEKDPGEIMIERNLTVDQQLSRAYLENGITRNVRLFPGIKNCKNFTVILTKSSSNRYSPISIHLQHKFLTKPEAKKVIYVDGQPIRFEMDKFCPRCPVYNHVDSIFSTILEVPFALGCKSGNICKANLTIEPQFVGLNDNVFILGSKNDLTLEIRINNLGEKAYQTYLKIYLPETVTLRRTPSACSETNSSAVQCLVDNPLDTNAQKLMVLDIDMMAVNSGKFDTALVFFVQVVTNSENDGDRVKNITIDLKREADITINGKSAEQSYSFRNLTKKSEFLQTYQIETFGSSLLNEIQVEINIPHSLKTNSQKINFLEIFPLVATPLSCSSNLTYSEEDTEENLGRRFARQVEMRSKFTEFDAFQNITFYLNCSSENIICSKIICKGGPVKSKEAIKISIKMIFDVPLINEFLNTKNVILLGTHGSVFVTNPSNFQQSGNRPDQVDVVTLFIGESQNENVALWIIIVSAVAGLLLLVLVIFGLIKAGFFKRSRKEELEQLKKEMELNNTKDDLNSEN